MIPFLRPSASRANCPCPRSSQQVRSLIGRACLRPDPRRLSYCCHVCSSKNCRRLKVSLNQDLDRDRPSECKLPGQVVLVFQGGGALGSYQAGVYQALYEADIEPDWIIGTSICAINSAVFLSPAPCRLCQRC